MENNNNLDSSLIQKCIDISCIEKNKLNSNISFGFKNKMQNWKDNLKYNFIRFNSKFDMVKGKIHIFNKLYDTFIESEKNKFYKKFNKIVMVTYRSKYRPQINIKNKKEYTTDCGWGCMIRSSQMILCRALYKIFKYNLKQNEKNQNLTKIIAPFVMDNYLNIIENKYYGMDNYINKLKSFGKNDIIEIDPPFSIHKICILGEKFGRTCGEWFSDYELPKIYDIINTNFDIIPNLSIIHFNSLVELGIILKRCFKEEIANNENNISNENNDNINNINVINNENIIKIEDKNYTMEKMGLIFISNRLGLNNVSPDYYPSLKKIFNCKEFIGIIGGKKKSNSASYFFGYYDNYLLYLDPHHNNISINKIDDNNINTYINKTIYKFQFSSLKSALTIGFLFRNMKEFNDLLTFFRNIKKDENSCFSFSEKMNKEEDNKEFNEMLNNISEKDDF